MIVAVGTCDGFNFPLSIGNLNSTAKPSTTGHWPKTSNPMLKTVRNWSSGRSFAGETPRYFSYPNRAQNDGHRNPSVWMGEHHCDISEPIILTEGQFDYVKVYPFYDHVLSGQTTQMQEHKLKRIAAASSIITIFDNGVGGDKGRERINKFFKGTPVQHLKVPEKYGDLGNCPDKVVYKLLSQID